MRDAEGAGFDEKGKGVVAGPRILVGEASAKAVEVRGGEGRDGAITAGEGLACDERMPLDGEANQGRRQQGRLQPHLQCGNGARWCMHVEDAFPFPKPQPLNEKRKATHVIAVHVRNQQVIHLRRVESRSGESGTDAITAIDRESGVANMVIKGRVTAVGAGPAVTHTKTPKMRLGLSI